MPKMLSASFFLHSLVFPGVVFFSPLFSGGQRGFFFETLMHKLSGSFYFPQHWKEVPKLPPCPQSSLDPLGRRSDCLFFCLQARVAIVKLTSSFPFCFFSRWSDRAVRNPAMKDLPWHIFCVPPSSTPLVLNGVLFTAMLQVGPGRLTITRWALFFRSQLVPFNLKVSSGWQSFSGSLLFLPTVRCISLISSDFSAHFSL